MLYPALGDQSGLGEAYGNTQKGWHSVTKDEEISEHCERFTRTGPSFWRSLALLLIIPWFKKKGRVRGFYILQTVAQSLLMMPAE